MRTQSRTQRLTVQTMRMYNPDLQGEPHRTNRQSFRSAAENPPSTMFRRWQQHFSRSRCAARYAMRLRRELRQQSSPMRKSIETFVQLIRPPQPATANQKTSTIHSLLATIEPNMDAVLWQIASQGDPGASRTGFVHNHPSVSQRIATDSRALLTDTGFNMCPSCAVYCSHPILRTLDSVGSANGMRVFHRFGFWFLSASRLRDGSAKHHRFLLHYARDGDVSRGVVIGSDTESLYASAHDLRCSRLLKTASPKASPGKP